MSCRRLAARLRRRERTCPPPRLVPAAGLFFAAAPACAAAAAPEGPSLAWAAVKMVVSLGVVLAILLLASRYSKKYMERFSRRGGGGENLAVTEVRATGLKTQVVVVEAFGARYILGVTPSSISVIDKVPSGGPGGAA